MLVFVEVDTGVRRARGQTLGLDLDNCIALRECLGIDVVGARGHRVIVAEFTLPIATSRDDPPLDEPFPGSSDLTTVAAKGEAVCGVAATSSIRNGEQPSEPGISSYADAIVESLSGTVGPARTTVRLVANSVDHFGTSEPVSTGIEVSR